MTGISFLHSDNPDIEVTLSAAESKMQCIRSISEMGIINLADVSWFNNNNSDKQLELYGSQKSLKILWFTNMDFLNWNGKKLAHILKVSDCCAAGSPYIHSILKECTTKKIYRLDIPTIPCERKEDPSLKIVSVLTEHENLETLHDIFSGLPVGLNKGAIDTNNYSQYSEIADVCGWTLQSNNATEIRRKIAECAIYLTATRAIPYHQHLSSARASKLWCFALKSPQHQGTQVIEFQSPEHGIDLITKKVSELTESFHLNENYTPPPNLGDQLTTIIKAELIS